MRVAPAPTAPAPRRALVPREHGAYGQLALPLVTGLALGRPTAAAALLAYALVAAFVAHEPVLVLLGHRGARAAQSERRRARRVLAILASQAVLAGVAGLWLAPPAARAALAAPAALAAAVGWLAARRIEKTIGGEVIVAAALSSGGLAVALAAGAPARAALAAWITWVLGFSTAVLAVQAVLERARSKGRRDPGPGFAALSAALVALALAAVRLAGLPLGSPLALLPMATLSVAICLGRPSAQRLRALGWAMVAAGTLTMALLVVTLR